MWGTGEAARSLRWFIVRLSELPFESSTSRELGAPLPGQWGNVEELLATVAEVADAGNRLFYMANTQKGTTPPEPLKIPRPWQRDGQTEPKRQSTPEEIARFMGVRMRVQYEPKEG